MAAGGTHQWRYHNAMDRLDPGDANDMLDTGELKQEAAWLYEVLQELSRAAEKLDLAKVTVLFDKCLKRLTQRQQRTADDAAAGSLAAVLAGGAESDSSAPPSPMVGEPNLQRPSSFRGSFAEGEAESRRLRPSKSSTTLAALAVNVAAAEQSEAELLFLCNAGLSIAEVFTTVVVL